jgi:hypothetical protein
MTALDDLESEEICEIAERLESALEAELIDKPIVIQAAIFAELVAKWIIARSWCDDSAESNRRSEVLLGALVEAIRVFVFPEEE